MTIIEEIKQARNQMLTEEQKSEILKRVKNQLVIKKEAIIDGARHYQNQEWLFRGETYVRAPFKYHAAISAWLEDLGFMTSRYYNRGGVDNGLQVWI